MSLVFMTSNDDCPNARDFQLEISLKAFNGKFLLAALIQEVSES